MTIPGFIARAIVVGFVCWAALMCAVWCWPTGRRNKVGFAGFCLVLTAMFGGTLLWAVVSAEDRQRGDVSGNGRVTAYDAALVGRHCQGAIQLSGADSVAADVDNDCGITERDGRFILRYVTGEFSEIPFLVGPCPCWLEDCPEWEE